MAMTPILGIPQIAPSQTDKTTTMNNAILAIESATQDQTTISLAAGDVTLTTAQLISYAMFVVTGATAAHNLIIPLQKRIFAVRNATSYTITVTGASGTGVAIPAASAALIQCDGTNCTQLAAGGQGPAGNWSAPVVSSLGPGLSVASGVLRVKGGLPLAFSFSGKPLVGQMIHLSLLADLPITLPVGLTGLVGYVGTNPTATATFTVSKVNGGTATSLGTISISTAGAITVSFTSAYNSASGDTLRLTAPSPQDATLADVCLTLEATRA